VVRLLCVKKKMLSRVLLRRPVFGVGNVRRMSHITLRDALPPLPHPEQLRAQLVKGCQQVLEAAKALPDNAEYKNAIVKLYEHRLAVANNTAHDVNDIEQTLQSGPMFELIEAAQDEAKIVIPLLLKVKPWELDDNNPIYAKEDPDFVPFERKVFIE
jgi:hypothetical protein